MLSALKIQKSAIRNCWRVLRTYSYIIISKAKYQVISNDFEIFFFSIGKNKKTLILAFQVNQFYKLRFVRILEYSDMEREKYRQCYI